MKKIILKLKCWLIGHKWTSAHSKGLPPTKDQIIKGYSGWKDYSKMYCDRCGHEPELNNRFNP